MFQKAKLWTKEKLGKKGPEDPEVENVSRKFLETKHETKELAKQSREWMTALQASFLPRNGIIDQVTKIGLLGEEKVHAGAEVQAFVQNETLLIKQQQAVVDSYQKIVLDPLDQVLKTVYECKDLKFEYDTAKEELDSAVEKSVAAQGKGADKQTVAAHEQKIARDKHDQCKASYLAKAAQVENAKIEFLRTALPAFTRKQAELLNTHDISLLPSSASSSLTPPAASSFVSSPSFGPRASPARSSFSDSSSPLRPGAPEGSTVAIISPAAPSASSARTVTAMYDYDAASDLELSFKTGDVITVIQQEDNGWWTGSLSGREGQFPITYVDLSNFPEAVVPSA